MSKKRMQKSAQEQAEPVNEPLTDNILSESDSEGDGNTKPFSRAHPPLQESKVKGKKQSLQLINHFFTWNNFPENAAEILETVFKKFCRRWIFQEEIGASGTAHLQGSIECIKKTRWEQFKLPSTIHWEKTRNVECAMSYCQKEETSTGKRWQYPRPRATLKTISALKPWQQSVVDKLEEEPDDRTVNWVFDYEGCMGKTVFSKYLVATKDTIVATGGSNKDIACLIAMLIKPDKHGEPGRDLNEKTTFVFNFPRSTEGISYKAIESVKDGLMTSVKYESQTLVFNCPHVWIFSNELPDQTKLSKDRWKIWTIIKGELVVYDNNTFKDILENTQDDYIEDKPIEENLSKDDVHDNYIGGALVDEHTYENDIIFEEYTGFTGQ